MLINGIFEGGGIKGLAYIGALRFLEERGFRFHKLGGTSIGAIISSLVAVGYNSYELENIVNNFDINILVNYKKQKRISKLIETVKQKGVYSIDEFEKYLFSLFKNKGKIYFRDLKLGNNYLFKCITTELKTKKMVVIPDDLKYFGYNPDGFLISKAVCMSSCIPFVFSPYTINNYSFVDGGVVNNFPITLFSNSNIPTIGFRLNGVNKENKIVKKIQEKVFKTELDFDLDKYNVIDIDTKGIKATEFRKGLDNKTELFMSGYNSMRNFFYKNYRC